MFNKGVISLSDMASSGTVYHEAFHAVTHVLMTDEELNSILDAARRRNPGKNDIELEEILAEDFRRYMHTNVSDHRDNVIVRLFKMLRNFVRGFRDKQFVITNAFYRISQGMYANRALRDTSTTRESGTQNNFTAEMNQIRQ